MSSASSLAENHDSRAIDVLVPTILTTAVAFILTGLRLYVRRFMIRMFGWDDVFNVLALFCAIVVMGLVIASTKYGLGRHFLSLDPVRAAYCVKLLRISEFFLIFSTVFLKISISLFLKRLFLTSKKWKIFFWCFIAFNSITSALDAAIIFPQCTPVEYNWNKGIKGTCWSDSVINGTGIAQGSIAAATDFILSLLPIIFLWNIKLARRVKVGICGIMALGFASGAFAIVRTALVPSLTATHDPTWDLVDLFKWAVLEATLGVIAAAAPSVRPLIGHNSMSTEYSRSKSRQISQSLPLHSMRTGRSSRHGMIDSMLDTVDDRGKESDGDSQSHLWAAGDDNGIMKTMSVEVVTTRGHGSDEPPTPTNWPLEPPQTNEIRRAASPHSPRMEGHGQV
ncbi:uncharacterized protein PFLUO_LOCUS624 [Penicillium psychrofluorescens]|uniref:uncharacterized protein n=1 Tax=Penicillium psychrofluorescens TaxID=3158075 RepID=UPI003CCE4DA0